MDKIKDTNNLENRFHRLRRVIEKLEERELRFEVEVLGKFNLLDMEGIEKLAEEKLRIQQYREHLQRFIDSYENKTV